MATSPASHGRKLPSTPRPDRQQRRAARAAAAVKANYLRGVRAR